MQAAATVLGRQNDWVLHGAVNVYLPKDRVTNQHQGYGFVEFQSEDDADYVSVWSLSYIEWVL